MQDTNHLVMAEVDAMRFAFALHEVSSVNHVVIALTSQSSLEVSVVV